MLIGATAALAAPSIGRAQASRVLKFIPHADLALLDPIQNIPTGLFYQPTAYRKTLGGVLKGFPLFYNVRRV